MRIQKKSQIATILTFIIALVFLFIVITINIGKVSQKKTLIDNACDGAGLLLASGLGSVSNAVFQEIGFYHFDAIINRNCNLDWLLIGGILAVIVGILGVVVSGGSSLILFAGGLTALGGAAVIAGDVLFIAYTEPGLLREMQAQYQNMTAEQRLFEGAMQYALFSTVDDPAFVPDRFDEDRDKLKAGDKIPQFDHWYIQRLSSLPRLGDIINTLYDALFPPGAAFFEIVTGSGGWVAKEAYLLSVDPANGQRFRVGDWLRDDFWLFMHELWCYGYGPGEFAKFSQAGPCGGGPDPPPPVGGWVWPTDPHGEITSTFNPGHPLGIDIGGLPIGTPILAAYGGTVIGSGWSVPGCSTCNYGQYIVIDHGMVDGKHLYSRYGHLNTILVSGGHVFAGQHIGEMGWTGRVEPVGPGGTHLHFEIREWGIWGRALDPMIYLTGAPGPGPGGSRCGAGAPTVKIEDAQDDVGELYRDIRGFEKFAKDSWGRSQDELIVGFEDWFIQLWNDEDVRDGYDSIGWAERFWDWIPKINEWREILAERQAQVLACMSSCRNQAYDCCPNVSGPECDWNCWQVCDEDGNCVTQCVPIKWNNCCGPWVECCDLCNDPHCSPHQQCQTPCNPPYPPCHVVQKSCCDSACCLKVPGSGTNCLTRIQGYIDKLNEFENNVIIPLYNLVVQAHLDSEGLKSNPWNRQAIYVWKDVVLNDLGAEVSTEQPAHMVYVKLDLPADFKFPYVTQKRHWLVEKCTSVEHARGTFEITVGRYDEDIAKRGPLSRFWRFKFRRGGRNEAAQVNTLRTAADRFHNLLNDGNATSLSSLMDPGEFNTLADLAYNQGVVAHIEVSYGPGEVYRKGEATRAADRNRDIHINRRIR